MTIQTWWQIKHHADEKSFSVCYIKRSPFREGNNRAFKHSVSRPTLWPWLSWDIKSTFWVTTGWDKNQPLCLSLSWPCCELPLFCSFQSSMLKLPQPWHHVWATEIFLSPLLHSRHPLFTVPSLLYPVKNSGDLPQEEDFFCFVL